MKKNHLIWLFALPTLFLTACEPGNTPEQITYAPITITATYVGNEESGSAGAPSRIMYAEDGTTITATWETGDQLCVQFEGHDNILTMKSGAGETLAVFSGTIQGSPEASSDLVCTVIDKNNPTPNLLSQVGTLASAVSNNVYTATVKYGMGVVECSFPTNISMLKLSVIAPVGVSAGSSATLTYKSDDTELARASFTVGANGENLIYLAVPVGEQTGTQSVVYTSGETSATRILSATKATFAANKTYNKWLSFRPVDIGTLSADYIAIGGDVLTGTLTGNHQISIAKGATVTLSGVSINANDALSHDCAGLTCRGDATLRLAGTNTIHALASNYPGIWSPSNLTINGLDTLTVVGGANAAGIGSSSSSPCGNILIEEGTITATGGTNAAGIGCGASAPCGTITIANTVKKVTATKGTGAPYSIGVATSGGDNSSCGTVTIGGIVYWDGSAFQNEGGTVLAADTFSYPNQ